MIYLLLSILCSALIFLIFKAFQYFGVNTFAAIVINYCTAAAVGILVVPEFPDLEFVTSSPWFSNSIILGFIFISLFYIMALTAQRFGPSVASIANKMALIVPVIFASYYYEDSMTLLKILGIIIALVGVYLSAIKPKVLQTKKKLILLWMPLVLFIGSGFIDTFLKFNQEFHLNQDETSAYLFTTCTFLTAFIIGLVVLISRKRENVFSIKTISGGIILGFINFGSIYFLIATFNQSELESSVVFPINNMGAVFLTSLSSWIIFKEQFSTINKIGILLSLVSILLISISA